MHIKTNIKNKINDKNIMDMKINISMRRKRKVLFKTDDLNVYIKIIKHFKQQFIFQ